VTVFVNKSLVEADDVGIPVFGVSAVDNSEYFRAEVVVSALTVFESDAQVAGLALGDFIDAFQLFQAATKLIASFLLLLVLFFQLEHLRL
jgi:hypothetical protein